MMFSGIRALLGLAQQAQGQIEFWRDYQGREIWIRSHTINSGSDTGNIQQNSYVIKGQVDRVMSHPPGFLLSDVEEVLVKSDLSLLLGVGSTEPQDVRGGTEANQVLRRVDEKFVSFDAIQQLEWAESAEQASEPFRE